MTVVLGAESYSAVGVGEPWPDIGPGTPSAMARLGGTACASEACLTNEPNLETTLSLEITKFGSDQYAMEGSGSTGVHYQIKQFEGSRK